MIQTEGLHKRYGKLAALEATDLTIEAGEVCGLVGPNGAGKSTLLKILATLIRPSGGIATIAGENVRTSADEVRRNIGYVPEQFGVYDGMSVSEYLEFFAAAYRITRKKRRGLIKDLLALTDLTVKRDSAVTGLSRGMKQRLALARALLHDPKVLLLDEPTSGLDPRARLEFASLIRELGGLGKTILVSSHLLGDLAGFCTSVLVLEKGRVVTHGPLEGLADSTGRLAVEAEVLERAEGAEQLLAAEPRVRKLDRVGTRLRFEVDGDSGDVAEIHTALAAQVPVVWFREQTDRLLEAFLTKTRGEVS
ncbi:MAG: ABC transporter ATP-binding protein [Planctomycetota bacterium]|jgi:ABC-2 type transport system ATP-binding protein